MSELSQDYCLKSPAGDTDCETAALHITDLSFSYTPGNHVLDNISICLHDGVFLGVIGPNGGGKSTLVKLILGLLPPKTGNINIFGQKHQSQLAKSHMGFVPQFCNFDTAFPVSTLDVVQMAVASDSGQKARAKAIAALDLCNATSLANKGIGEISGGQRQRVLIARALVNEPRLLILDEPTNSLDSQSQHDFSVLLKKLQSDLKLSILMVSHDVGQLVQYADRIACINRTLHWHDHAKCLTDAIVRQVFDCELASWQVSLSPTQTHTCENCR